MKGFFAWCFMDMFEYVIGFMSLYGLYRVDFEDEALPIQARLSARWYSEFLRSSRSVRSTRSMIQDHWLNNES